MIIDNPSSSLTTSVTPEQNASTFYVLVENFLTCWAHTWMRRSFRSGRSWAQRTSCGCCRCAPCRNARSAWILERWRKSTVLGNYDGQTDPQTAMTDHKEVAIPKICRRFFRGFAMVPLDYLLLFFILFFFQFIRFSLPWVPLNLCRFWSSLHTWTKQTALSTSNELILCNFLFA